MKIGIFFGDNDFGITIREFLKLFENSSYNHHNMNNLTLDERFTKERIAFLFNNSATTLYYIKQNGFCYNLDINYNTNNYLKIDKSDVYINEEVDKMLKKDNDACFHFIEIK